MMKHSVSRRATGVVLHCLVMAIGLAPRVFAQAAGSPQPARALHQAIAAGDIIGARHGDLPRYREALSALYADSAAHALWLDGAGLTANGEALLCALAAAGSRGLRPADYDVELLAQRVLATSTGDDEARLRFDAAMSLAAMRFLDHVHRGRVDPRTLGFALGVPHALHDLAPLVGSLSDARHVSAAIDAVEPPYARYRALERSLTVLRALAADSSLTALPAVRGSVHPGETWAGTASLERLLLALGDVPASTARQASDTLDGVLVSGVKHFQRRHGLAQDGLVGGATLAAMRVPLSRRVEQVELAMERWRWLPDIVSTRVVVVNIPAFQLYAFDRETSGERPVERMDVIVGSAYNRRRTPVFTGTMRSVVFQPYW
ncbi:MAG: peptidoglycan-binding protein, partial [bacterium]